MQKRKRMVVKERLRVKVKKEKNDEEIHSQLEEKHTDEYNALYGQS